MEADQKSVETTYRLDDTTIAGLMQLLTLSIVTGTNLMDHLRLMELRVGDDGRLLMTDDFIRRSEEFAQELTDRVEVGGADSEPFSFFD